MLIFMRLIFTIIFSFYKIWFLVLTTINAVDDVCHLF